ncbi:MAG: phosphotransferase [Solirubrobacteraceae bacterium]
MGGNVPVLRRPEELTSSWLAEALGTGPIDEFTVEPIGTGQMSESRRVSIDYAPGPDTGPASVVLKTASADENSRSVGVSLGVYDREVRFYSELAPRVGGPLPQCYTAVIDPREGWFTLLLEDVAPAVQGDQITGCAVEQARLATLELARLHAPVFADPQLGATPWLNQEMVLGQALMTQLLPTFLERYGDRVAPEHREVCRRFVASLDGWVADRRPPLGLVHGDYRLDNMLFGAADAPRRFAVVDWQTVSWGPVMTDLSYFLGGSLAVEDRRAHEHVLVRDYYDALHAHGVRGFDWDQCWDGYRRQSFLGILMTVGPAVLVERTERGDEMFLVSLSRYAQQILDLDALELLPEAGSGRPPALRPQPSDEGRHAPGPEELWNESWYFDAISEDGRTGVYTRLGLYPNLGVSWLTAFVCGPDRPTVAIVEFAAPVPDGEELTVDMEGLHAEHICDSPLERFRIRIKATGETHADPAALLRGEAGDPVPVTLDLEWQTLGEPYAYRVTTRYEIPCRVNGTVSVGDETIELRGVGQRDHSWGTRDWWSAEWMWSAGHLDDGTRFHGVEFRLPGAPPIGVGYLQPPNGGLLELDSVSASEEVGPDGLITTAQISYGELTLRVQPLAFGPLRLEAPDGRVSQFPRAMCRVSAEDGRTGVAWVEWNRNASVA